MTIPYKTRGPDYLQNPLSRLRRQLSQRESQDQVSRYIVF